MLYKRVYKGTSVLPFSIFFLDVSQQERPVTRDTRHCANRYIDPLPFQLIGGFPRGAFDDQPSTAAATVTPLLPLYLPFP